MDRTNSGLIFSIGGIPSVILVALVATVIPPSVVLFHTMVLFSIHDFMLVLVSLCVLMTNVVLFPLTFFFLLYGQIFALFLADSSSEPSALPYFRIFIHPLGCWRRNI